MTATAPPLHFITSNPHKAREVEALLGANVKQIRLALAEIQAGSVVEIVRAKLEAGKDLAPPPLAVEDVSLEIEALGGFPGPYVKWLIEAAGGDGLGAIAEGLSTRTATARCVVGIWDGDQTHLAGGAVRGEILTRPRGSREFGWDAWFVPDGSDRTYGEMSPEEKASGSHRARAWNAAREILLTVLDG